MYFSTIFMDSGRMENLMNFIMKELYRNIQMLIRLGVVLGFIGLKGRHLTDRKMKKKHVYLNI